MKTTYTKNDKLLLRMVRMRINSKNPMYCDGISKDWLIATIQSLGQELDDGDVDTAIREGMLVDSGKNFLGQKIYRPAEYVSDDKSVQKNPITKP